MSDERTEFERYSCQRLYPAITNPSWLVLRGRRRIFTEWLRGAPSGLNVLDIGGALQPYKPLLPQEGLRYTAVDLKPSPLVDKIASATDLPFSDNTFDLVICTQVLEYVPNPYVAFAEIRRVLKPGAVALASVPAAQPIDSLEDGWRFLPAGIRDMTKEFASVEIVAETGNVGSLFRTINLWLAMYAPLRRLWHYTLIPLLNMTAILLKRSSDTREPGFCVNYAIRATR